jgi:predicted phage terminase large subunit-like protein
MLEGFKVGSSPESGDKVTRFSPFSAQAEAGNVLVLRGPWNEDWFSSLEAFPDAPHDDDADSTSRAFNALIADPARAALFLSSRHR